MYSSLSVCALWIYLCIAHEELILNLSVHNGVLYSCCALIAVSACGAVMCLRSFNMEHTFFSESKKSRP